MDMLAVKHVVDAADDIRGAVWSSAVSFTSGSWPEPSFDAELMGAILILSELSL